MAAPEADRHNSSSNNDNNNSNVFSGTFLPAPVSTMTHPPTLHSTTLLPEDHPQRRRAELLAAARKMSDMAERLSKRLEGMESVPYLDKIATAAFVEVSRITHDILVAPTTAGDAHLSAMEPLPIHASGSSQELVLNPLSPMELRNLLLLLRRLETEVPAGSLRYGQWSGVYLPNVGDTSQQLGAPGRESTSSVGSSVQSTPFCPVCGYALYSAEAKRRHYERHFIANSSLARWQQQHSGTVNEETPLVETYLLFEDFVASNLPTIRSLMLARDKRAQDAEEEPIVDPHGSPELLTSEDGFRDMKHFEALIAPFHSTVPLIAEKATALHTSISSTSKDDDLRLQGPPQTLLFASSMLACSRCHQEFSLDTFTARQGMIVLREATTAQTSTPLRPVQDAIVGEPTPLACPERLQLLLPSSMFKSQFNRHAVNLSHPTSHRSVFHTSCNLETTARAAVRRCYPMIFETATVVAYNTLTRKRF